jgi:erythrocyte band 7 integral membrane protein
MSDLGKAPLGEMNGGSSHRSRDDVGPIIKVQPPRREDLQPSYAQAIQPDTEDESTHGWYGGMVNTLGTVIGTLGAIPCCLCCPNPYRPVEQGSVGLVTKFGRFARAVDPGLVKVNPLSEKLIAIDVKIQIVGTYSSDSPSLRPANFANRGPQAGLHDQGQRLALPHICHLLPHHLTPQGRIWN